MPMDGFTLSFLQKELRDILVGGRVDKISQPERDTLALLIRSHGANHRLLLSANPSQARIQLTAQAYENPAEPPMFCMLLRKHLVGSHITGLAQLSGDRVIQINFEGIGELGDRAKKTIYLEMMGRHSNLMLVDDKGMILDSLKHVSSDMSRVRTVLPGQAYRLPPGQGKLQPDEMTADQIKARLESLSLPPWKGFAENIAGMASVCARELAAQLGLAAETECRRVRWEAMAPAVHTFFAGREGRLAPVVLEDEFGVALDFFPFPYLTFDLKSQRPVKTLSEAMDAFYLGRDVRLRMDQRSAGVHKHIKNAILRLEKKQGILLEAMEQGDRMEQNRVFGELLTANLHRLSRGQETVTLPNYYDPAMAEVTIPLSVQHTPAQNAQNYYKKYRKAKAAAEYAQGQMEKTRAELELLENAMEDLGKCESTADLAEIRAVLAQNGYLRPEPSQRKRKKLLEGKPYRFLAEDGTEIWVGKNSLQNDRLTMGARGNDIWLHAQGIPGSHVLIRTEEEPASNTLLKAAKLAAYFSRGRNHPALPVDYTKRKYVKKVPGAAAGFVTYTHFGTVLVGLSQEDLASIGKESAENSRKG